MNFKLWLIEDTKLARKFKSEGTEIPLGKFGRFNSIYIHKNDTPDNSKEALQILQKDAPEANYRLSYLGFPSHTAKTIINDGYTFQHHIMGGESSAFGYAIRNQHGMTISFDFIKQNGAIDVLVHEYAHMYWFMMSPKAKNLFIKQYQEFYDNLTDKDIQQNINPDILLQKLLDKLQSMNLMNKIANIIQKEYQINGQNIPVMKFLMTNKESLIKKIEPEIHSFFMYADFPVHDDGKTYLGDESEFTHGSTQALTAEKLLNQIINSYNHYYKLNQGTEDLNYFFNNRLLKNYIDKTVLQAGESYLKQNISKPSGQYARYSMAKKFKLPSDYSASNYDELWAVTVEEASKNLKNINPQLKKLLMNAIFLSK